jgi:hypothetical protein
MIQEIADIAQYVSASVSGPNFILSATHHID